MPLAPVPQRYSVTAALPYANGSLHLGHLMEYIQTDIWYRFQKAQGNECYYVCADDVEAGTLVKAIPDWSAGQPQISLLMPSRQGVLPAVEAFTQYLREALPDVLGAGGNGAGPR